MDFRVEWYDRLASTNAHMREQFLRGMPIHSGLIVAAREQTAGRGRQDRTWLSAPNQNLCCSLFLETTAELMAVPSLTMAATLAITEMLNAKRIPAAPKWPNDILVGRKKICGILSERVERTENPQTGIIVGIGLNINMTPAEAAAIDRPATSMLIETGQAGDPEQTLESLLAPLEEWIGQWEKGGFDALRPTWTQKAGPIGKTLTVHDGDLRKTGRLAGFGGQGELLLQTPDGLETIWSGDVS